MTEIDIGAVVASLDNEDMLGFLRLFPQDFVAQMEKEAEHPGDRPSRVTCLGMGGSAAAGDFIASLSDYQGECQVLTHRGYSLPNWLSDGLVISTSYSGNTEETLDATSEANLRALEVIGISSGGELGESNNHILVPSGQPPRSAFGHLFGALLRTAISRGVIPSEDMDGLSDRLKETVEEFDFVTNSESPTLDIARTLLGKEIGIISAPELDCAGVRFVNQLNENGGVFARSKALPEMNHNEIIAWTDEAAKESQALIFLTWDGMHPRVSKRVEWMMDNVEVDIAWQLHCDGESLLESMLYSCIVMDWVSCAIAILRGKDPSAIGAIRSLKGFLSE
ncbi:MAG: hypothetical protein H8D82_01220 [Euryarchaeota archaeon]|nr:hypothetical protein [Euryarchaeota archaeon]